LGEVEAAGVGAFPDDELPAEIGRRESFNAEEMCAYAVDLDAIVEEQGILEVVCTATSLWEELREELQEEGHNADEPPDGGNKVIDDDYIHLDDDLDEDDLADLPDDVEAEEAAAE
jgi:hypothetical protein